MIGSFPCLVSFSGSLYLLGRMNSLHGVQGAPMRALPTSSLLSPRSPHVNSVHWPYQPTRGSPQMLCLFTLACCWTRCSLCLEPLSLIVLQSSTPSCEELSCCFHEDMTLELCVILEKSTHTPFLPTTPYNLRTVICLEDGQDPFCPSPWLYWPLLAD